MTFSTFSICSVAMLSKFRARVSNIVSLPGGLLHQIRIDFAVEVVDLLLAIYVVVDSKVSDFSA